MAALNQLLAILSLMIIGTLGKGDIAYKPCSYNGEVIHGVTGDDSYQICFADGPEIYSLHETRACPPDCQPDVASADQGKSEVSTGLLGGCRSPGILLHNTTTCSLYYTCNEYCVKEQQRCPEGTNWNPFKNKCTEYVCPYPECRYQGVNIPDFTNCANYYTCDANLKHNPVPCPEGDFFSMYSRNCQEKSTVECLSIPGCTYIGEVFTNVYNCSNFYMCGSDLTPKLMDCPNDLHWDSVTNDCNDKRYARCGEPKWTPDCTTVAQKFPDPFNCHSFYICDEDKEAQHMSCGALVYNPGTNICESENVYPCSTS